MDLETITARLRTYFEDELRDLEGVSLTDVTDLPNEWLLDSLAILEIVLFIERTFGVSIGRADLSAANFKNVASLASLVATKLDSRSKDSVAG